MLKRVPGLNYSIALLIIVSLNFFLPRLMPGDPLMAIYGEEAVVQMTPEMQAELTARFALDQPLWEQFFNYMSALLTGDFGYSYFFNAPVFEVVWGYMPWTLLLVGTAVIISTLAGIFFGIESGWRRGAKSDKALLSGFMFLNGFPDFFIGMIFLIVFGVVLGLFPLSGALTPYSGLSGLSLISDVLWHLILPAASLTAANLTGQYLLTRNTMIATLGEAYITTARAKGLSDSTIRYRHAGRSALLPVITRTGIQIGRLFTGAIFVEIVFSYPGLGILIQTALETRDYTLLQGVLLLVTVFVLTVNFFVDLLYEKLDPRLKQCI